MKKLLQALSTQLGIVFYLYDKPRNILLTIDGNNVWEGQIPDWMLSFINSGNPVLSFEQDGKEYSYLYWMLSPVLVLVLLDDKVYSATTKLIVSLMATVIDNQSAATDNSQLSAVKAQLEQRLMNAGVEINQLKAALAKTQESDLTQVCNDLKSQNIDLGNRLKDALNNNLALNHQLNQLKMDGVPISPKTRTMIGALKDETTRLSALLKEAEDRYQQISRQQSKGYTPPVQAPKSASTTAVEELFSSSPVQSVRGMYNVINALNRVISTGSADGLKLDVLGTVVPLPPKSELEKNPEAVKAVITKLIGMERSGRLTSYQIKKLNDAFA